MIRRDRSTWSRRNLDRCWSVKTSEATDLAHARCYLVETSAAVMKENPFIYCTTVGGGGGGENVRPENNF